MPTVPSEFHCPQSSQCTYLSQPREEDIRIPSKLHHKPAILFLSYNLWSQLATFCLKASKFQSYKHILKIVEGFEVRQVESFCELFPSYQDIFLLLEVRTITVLIMDELLSICMEGFNFLRFIIDDLFKVLIFSIISSTISS